MRPAAPAADLAHGIGVAEPTELTPNSSPQACGSSNLATEVERAFQERERIVEQMEALASFLNSEGMPGLRGPLVDKDGFPRADIDVYSVREARHRLACLQTDYREAQRRVEQLLLRLHAKSANLDDTASAPRRTTRAQVGEAETNVEPPPLLEVEGPAFAVVDVLQPESPSTLAGLVCGDRILRLGSLRLASTLSTREAAASSVQNGAGQSGDENRGSSSITSVNELFRQLPGEVERHKDMRMPVVVRRGNLIISLWLTPRLWTGRGLLGCHLNPIPQE
ncbi:hypothetical protein Efla_003084 [Eimeria flavescens]